ncbi:MAG: hypothetical protein EXR72_22305 [Myxococcales bacterium]|nr:hypothetical protein [Myxococcales bacterium]
MGTCLSGFATLLFTLSVTLSCGCATSSEETRRTGTTPEKEVEGTGEATSDPSAIPPEKFDELDQYFHGKVATLQFNCYNQEVERTHQKYEGNLSLSILVKPGGKTGSVTVTNSTLHSLAQGADPKAAAGIEECVLSEIKGWEWPEVPAPAPYSGSVNFKPAW